MVEIETIHHWQLPCEVCQISLLWSSEGDLCCLSCIVLFADSADHYLRCSLLVVRAASPVFRPEKHDFSHFGSESRWEGASCSGLLTFNFRGYICKRALNDLQSNGDGIDTHVFTVASEKW